MDVESKSPEKNGELRQAISVVGCCLAGLVLTSAGLAWLMFLDSNLAKPGQEDNMERG